ncbi:multifunctional CCA addition/repair protein [Aurantivibrio infirmus]
MEIYLVGGAVRDKLLNYPSIENDWVVVGGSPKELLDRGFRQVGSDFPVFLHPETNDEYALARTERKSGHGYAGFTFHAAPDVSLEEDLCRRDLTINAIAMDDAGNLVDPYEGAQDIQNKLLRHVSPSFAEDPVRILRVARFAARYHHLGFTVAEPTKALMKSMVENGEVDHLVSERVWKEMSRALAEKNPQVFFEVLRECDALKRLLPEIDNLFGIPQPPQHHPEIDCGIHTLLVLQQAAILSDKTTVRFASLVHDLGKALTPEDVLPRHIGHESKSGKLIKNMCKRLAIPNEHRDLALGVAEYHTHCHRVLEMTPKKILKTLDALDSFRRPERFEEFLLCCEADARGRTGLENREYPQTKFFKKAFQRCCAISSKDVDSDRYQGKAFGEELHRLRIHALRDFKNSFDSTSTSFT